MQIDFFYVHAEGKSPQFTVAMDPEAHEWWQGLHPVLQVVLYDKAKIAFAEPENPPTPFAQYYGDQDHKNVYRIDDWNFVGVESPNVPKGRLVPGRHWDKEMSAKDYYSWFAENQGWKQYVLTLYGEDRTHLESQEIQSTTQESRASGRRR